MAVENPRQVFEQEFPARVQARPTLPQEINASYQFDVTGPAGGTWTVDLTAAGGGKISEGKAGEPGCVVTVADNVFVDIINKKTNTQMAFMSGKIKVSNVNLALKLVKVL
jgi:hypothetical protein